MNIIDALLNKVTMYKLVVCELIFLLCAAALLGGVGALPYNPLFLLFSAVFIFSVSFVFNKVFAFMFDVPSNPESTWITALILILIITPPSSWVDMQYLALAFWAGAWASASKYIFAIGKKHVFNPAAIGVAITSLVLGLSASWWVGTPAMVPFVLVGGLLLVRKIHRFDLWWAFMGVFTVGSLYFALSRNGGVLHALSQSLLYAPAFFFATVMLTEPMTTPPTRVLRMLYGGIIAFLFLPDIGFGSFYFTPELALLAGNIVAYIVSPKYKRILTLVRTEALSPDVYEFAFAPDGPLRFKAGQYLEWTLAHKGADSRGIRRFFTVASSPSQSELRLGVKFYEPSSTFKKALLRMKEGDTMVASQLSGDFTLPSNVNKKLVFIAGGIGSTPFASMIQYQLDLKQRRPITLLYANKTPEDAVYAGIFNRAAQEIGLKVVYAFNGPNVQLPSGAVSVLNGRTIQEQVPDYLERTFYISGPQGMVNSYKNLLLKMGVSRFKIKTDYFPGFA